MSDAPRPRRRLFWRVYLYGVALLVLVVLAAMATAFIFDSKFPASEITRRTSRLVAKDLARNYERPGLLRARLADLQYVLNANVAVYRGDGKLVAAAGKAPDPLSAQRARDLGKHTMLHGRGRRGMTLAVILEGQAGAYLIIGNRQGHGGLVKLAGLEAVGDAGDRVAFACGHDHDALVGLLLVRALNARAVLRHEEQASSRGILAAPSAQTP